VTNVLFNLLNPEVYATFAEESRTDISHFGVSIGLYNRNKYTKKQLTKSYRKSINPDVIKFPNLHPIVLVPTLFLLSLFLTTPISWKSKMVRIPIALFVLYICLIFYYSYIFSITLNNGNFEFDSIWHIIIRPFGVDNAELINIFALIIWAFLSIPLIINHHTHKISV
jgi:glucan phosphoethanolaminetransferase (alkaline phosphatase superfamily)